MHFNNVTVGKYSLRIWTIVKIEGVITQFFYFFTNLSYDSSNLQKVFFNYFFIVFK